MGIRSIHRATARDVFDIIDDLYVELQLSKDGRGFYNNRTDLLEAFAEGQLFIVEDIYKADEDNPRSERQPSAVAKAMRRTRTMQYAPLAYAPNRMPAFIAWPYCTKMMIWVRSDYRHRGYAKLMIDTFKPRVLYAIPEAVSFWEHMGFKSDGPGRRMVKEPDAV